ncbi:hypothetical protein ACJX0J_033560, partial [Zea mays]
ISWRTTEGELWATATHGSVEEVNNAISNLMASQLMIKGTNKIMPTLLHVLLVSQVLNALFNLCKINKRRHEQATENRIIPHLMKFVMSDSPLRQKVEKTLLKKEAIQNLVKFFQDCPEQFFGHILDAFLKIITKSS